MRRIDRIKKTCERCGNGFECEAWESARGRRFCSRDCGNTQRRNTTDDFWKSVKRTRTCWEWVGCIVSNGYGRFTIADKMISAHRFAWELANGTIPKGLMVCHKCDNRKCVRPDHLFVGTCSDNMVDCSRKGRINRGVDRPAAKLTPRKVRAIRRRFASGETKLSIAKSMGVAHNSIRGVIFGRTWTHVQ